MLRLRGIGEISVDARSSARFPGRLEAIASLFHEYRQGCWPATVVCKEIVGHVSFAPYWSNAESPEKPASRPEWTPFLQARRGCLRTFPCELGHSSQSAPR